MGGGRQIEGYPKTGLSLPLFRLPSFGGVGGVFYEVSGLLIFHMVLSTRTTTTGALRSLIAPRLRGIEAHGILIEHLILMGIDRAHQLVVEKPLVIVHIAGIVRIEAVQVLGELCQIVGTAGLVERRLRIIRH